MTNKQVIENFINGKAAHSSNGNLATDGTKLFNYGTCIAQHTQKGTIVSATRYSVTTSKIQHTLRYMVGTYKETTKDVPFNAYDLERYV